MKGLNQYSSSACRKYKSREAPHEQRPVRPARRAEWTRSSPAPAVPGKTSAAKVPQSLHALLKALCPCIQDNCAQYTGAVQDHLLK